MRIAEKNFALSCCVALFGVRLVPQQCSRYSGTLLALLSCKSCRCLATSVVLDRSIYIPLVSLRSKNLFDLLNESQADVINRTYINLHIISITKVYKSHGMS